MKKPTISIVVAIGNKKRAIGLDNTLLWRIPDDMKRFKEITMGHPVIMGRKTYESIPEKYRPLPGRDNIVLTRQNNYSAPEGVYVVHSLKEALEQASSLNDNEIFIGGGGQIYEESLPHCDKIYLTIVDSDIEGDSFFPDYTHENFNETSREDREYDGLKYSWINLER